MKPLTIAHRTIGPGHPVYVIAEIGVNHDGDVGRACQLVSLAAAAGADAVKFQFFEADRLMSRASKLAAYQRASGESDPLAMLRRLELSLGALARCIEAARRVGVHAIVSIFSIEHVKPAVELPWDALKTASPDIVNRPLLEAMAATGKPLLMSTGAATMPEIERAMDWLTDAPGPRGLLQCVSSYPTPWDEAEFAGIPAVASLGLPTGYSDHTPAIEAGAEAVRWGACMLEKHFTYDTTARGPDHAASLTPEGLTDYIRRARAQPPADVPGKALKRVLEREFDVRTVSRQSLTSAGPLRAGARVERSDLTVKRPGTGLSPALMDRVIGSVLKRDVDADTPLTPEDVELAVAVSSPEVAP